MKLKYKIIGQETTNVIDVRKDWKEWLLYRRNHLKFLSKSINRPSIKFKILKVYGRTG